MDSVRTTGGSNQKVLISLWYCPYHDKLLTERFDDEYVMFNSLSGETHVLNKEAKHVIDLISGQPRTVEQIEAAYMQKIPEASDAISEIIARHLEVLEQWGLAVRSRI